MKFQLNTDANTRGSEALAAKGATTVEQAPGRLGEQGTRVAIHRRDEQASGRPLSGTEPAPC